MALMMFFLFWNEAGTVFPNVFNQRDYLRIQDILNGHPVFYGPELSRNGHIPGAFYYYLLLIPYALAGYMGPVFVMFFLLSLGFGFFWMICRKHNWHSSFLIPALLFLIGPVHKNLRDMVWNPSFVPAFWLGVLYFLYLSVTEEKKRERNWILFSVLSALSIQLHMSGFSWFFLGQFFFWRQVKSFRLWVKGLLVFLLFFLPYGLWRLSHPAPSLGTQEAKALSSFLVFLQGLGRDFSLKQVWDSFLFFFRWPFLAALAGSLVVRGLENKKELKRWKSDLFFLLLFFLSLVFILPVFIHRENPRYVLFPFFLGVLYVGFSLQTTKQEGKKFPLYILISAALLWEIFSFRSAFSFYSMKEWIFPAIALFVLMAAFLFFRSVKMFLVMVVLFLGHQVYSLSFLGRTEKFLKLVPLQTMKVISEEIFAETGWSTEEMQRRVWWGGVLPEISLQYVYEDFVSSRKIHANSAPDGIFVIHKRAWNYGLPVKVQVIKKKKIGSFVLISYKSAGENFPLFVQNTGLPVAKASVYTDQMKGAEVFKLSTFGEKENDVFLFYKKSSGELIFFSEELSRFYTLGPSLYLEGGRLDFICDGRERSLELPDLGTSSGHPGADIYKGFAHPDSYFKRSIYTPLVYQVSCKSFLPREFRAEAVRKVIWGKKADSDEILSGFRSSFVRLTGK